MHRVTTSAVSSHKLYASNYIPLWTDSKPFSNLSAACQARPSMDDFPYAGAFTSNSPTGLDMLRMLEQADAATCTPLGHAMLASGCMVLVHQQLP